MDKTYGCVPVSILWYNFQARAKVFKAKQNAQKMYVGLVEYDIESPRKLVPYMFDPLIKL